MEEQPISARPQILWGQPAITVPLETQEGGCATALANTLAVATAVLDGEREKHEKRCA